MMIGWAMSLLDIAIVNITIPELQDDLSTDIGTVTWVINAYNIIFAVLLVSMGRLADQFGRRLFFVIGLSIFTIGSGLCALAWSVEWLIGFRVVQGIGAGILAPIGFAITVLVFPPQQRGRGLALIAVVALVSSALGPVLGGVLVEIASWHWIFLINIPFGILGVILALRWWPETWDLSAGREVDVRGMVLLGLAAGAIGSLLLLSLVFLNLWGYEPIEAALAILPVPLCGLIVWPFVGRAADSRAPGEIAKPALVVMAIGLLWISFLPATSDNAFSYLRILPGLAMLGVGMGIGFPALNVGAMGAVSGLMVGLASGVVNTARQLGAAIGVAILIATFGGALHAHMSWFADEEIEDIVDEWEIPQPEAGAVIQATLHDYAGGTSDRFEPKPGFDEEIIRQTAGSAREGFAWACREAATERRRSEARRTARRARLLSSDPRPDERGGHAPGLHPT